MPAAGSVFSAGADPLGLIADLIRAFASSRDAEATMHRSLAEVVRHMGAEAGSLFLLEDPADGVAGRGKDNRTGAGAVASSVAGSAVAGSAVAAIAAAIPQPGEAKATPDSTPDPTPGAVDAGATLVCRSCLGPVDVTGLRLPAAIGIVGRTASENRSQLVRDARADPDFGAWVDDVTGFSTRSILCAPLSVGDLCFGVIEIINKRGDAGPFDEDDRKVLEALAGAAALAMLNARLTLQVVERERLLHELGLAAQIQRALLPAPAGGRDPIQGLNRAAHDVSGDFYDVLTDPAGRRWFCIGDVAGKGMNAALLMAKTASLFRCLAKTLPGPGPLLDVLNAELCETATHGMFVTMVAGLVDPGRGGVRLANAGHEPPLVYARAADAFHSLPAQAPPLGIDPGIAGPGGFREETVPLTGCDLVLVTDGVTEARLEGGRPYGIGRVREAVRRHAGKEAGAMLTGMVDHLLVDHRARPRDDVTILLVRGEAADPPPATGAATLPGAGAESGRRGSGRPEPAIRSADVAADPAGPAPGGGDRIAGESLLSLRLPARAESLRVIRACLRETLATLGCSESWRRDMVMAVDEACQNVIRHAYPVGHPGPLDLGLWRVPTPDKAGARAGAEAGAQAGAEAGTASPARGRLVVTLRDFAPPVAADRVLPRALDGVGLGGLGTHLIRAVTDECVFGDPPDGRGGNLLRLVKALD